MAQHVNHLLAEYYDNELNAHRRRQVETHLDECATCRAELERMTQLSSLMEAYTLPEASTPVETFRAQVMLKVSRRKRSPLPSRTWVWYAIPVSLGGALLALEAVTALLILAVSALSWGGIEIAASLAPTWVEWLNAQISWSDMLISSGLDLLSLTVQVLLYIVLFLLFIPYAGWVGLLWRSVHKSLTK
ncbi:MAG: zf-HC2 domain-containing protein [Anaerolineae bacterium]|nr:zf-HC2 domain-containing protein [Anaerolineae bacterium]